MFAPEFPRPVVIAFNMAFGAIFFLVVMQIALDLAALASMVLPGRGWVITDGWRYAAMLAATLLAGFAVRQAVRVPPLKTIEVAIKGLPPGCDGTTLLHLTDLHISRLFPASWARAVVERSNALGADLIVVTGDFIDGSLAMRRADVEPLRGLRARDGIWAVPGNHEYFFDYDTWMAHFAGMGIHILANAHAVIERGGNALVVAGVTDRSAPATGHSGPDLDAALAGAPTGAPIVLLDHQPSNASAAAARGVALQLSGHTHGGMIRGLDRLVARGNGGFVSGIYTVGDMLLYVSNGTTGRSRPSRDHALALLRTVRVPCLADMRPMACELAALWMVPSNPRRSSVKLGVGQVGRCIPSRPSACHASAAAREPRIARR